MAACNYPRKARDKLDRRIHQETRLQEMAKKRTTRSPFDMVYTMESPRLRRGGARLRLAVYEARLRLAVLLGSPSAMQRVFTSNMGHSTETPAFCLPAPTVVQVFEFYGVSDPKAAQHVPST
ncbi:hypothetical protein L596_026753 [Steinernema carpocapsae]|uniref:Uncharacterized protein n=1 Tax=Steinernema carpocapsae TaxID=34508 RepID=A0A4U5M296_STECR|nr:hypothetical protein L596_026753 [Steinernema carpocapsae]